MPNLVHDQPDVIISVSINLHQSGAGDQRMIAVMDVDILRVARRTGRHCTEAVRVTTNVDNRYRAQTTIARVKAAGLLSNPQRLRISISSLPRHDHTVDVMTTDVGIKIRELLERDDAVVERPQPILDTGIVHGLRAKPVPWSIP